MSQQSSNLAEPQTLTDAVGQSQVVYVERGLFANQSNAREVPYAEVYRDSSSVRETPIARIQRVAEGDADQRAASR